MVCGRVKWPLLTWLPGPNFEAAFSVKPEDSFRAALPQRKERQPASLGKDSIFQAHKVLK